MATKKKRSAKREAQLARRKQASKARKLESDLERLYALGPGGSRERPRSLATPSLLKSSAESVPCPLCGERLRMKEDSVDRSTDELLRVAHLSCSVCGRGRDMWFRLEEGAN